MKDVFFFSERAGTNENAALRLIGNKGARLSEMTRIGLPVPRGFTISSNACRAYYQSKKISPRMLKEVHKNLQKLERITGKQFGKEKNPLLVSVRYSSYYAMPGLMDSILNIGMNDATVRGVQQQAGKRTAWDSYRRLIEVYSHLVLRVPIAEFYAALAQHTPKNDPQNTASLSGEELQDIVHVYKAIVHQHTGKEFPQDAEEQIAGAMKAVFDSWMGKKAVAYRKMHKLDEDMHTGCVVQEMVFGNRGRESGTGVAFSRNPITGKKEIYGEFIINAQGEDIMSGFITPQPIGLLKKALPKAFAELEKTARILEKKYQRVQDIEFTIDSGKLFLLETRPAKLTAQASMKVAIDLVKEKMVSREQALLSIRPEKVEGLLHHEFVKEKNPPKAIARGVPASPGAASGIAVFSVKKAREQAREHPGRALVLIRPDTTPEDIEGLGIATGILTSAGGSTSHAAVVSRGMGKPCIVGCTEIQVSPENETLTAGTHTLQSGDWISIDGTTGEIFAGKRECAQSPFSPEFKTVMRWADSVRKLGVRANADTGADAWRAREFGAEGIGLCRTEHMFFEEKRITAVREMILADTREQRQAALDKLLPYQESDFAQLFKAMRGLPVTIRLLDPPLHEFLPRYDQNLKLIAQQLHIPVNELEKKIRALHESNPMLGFRGCRLGVVFPEINEMQVKAIIRAAVTAKRNRIAVQPEIMIPIVSSEREMQVMKELVDRIAREELQHAKENIPYKTGCMIELPSAALIADKLAAHSAFFSFGTNDLTQTTLGFSRDDAGKFIETYVDKKILKDNPFKTLEVGSVGELMRIAVRKIRKTGKTASIGICGEHGGDPESIAFAHAIGLTYVSCSPYRVPVARMAAAHAALKKEPLPASTEDI